MRKLKSTVDLLVFGNFYIAGAAVVMCYYTDLTFNRFVQPDIFWFVFFSTMSSYSLHWFLTPTVSGETGDRIRWTLRHKALLGALFLFSLPLTAYYFYLLKEYAFWIALPAVVTFLYTAPKIPFAPFIWLRRFVVGKTLYLAIVWTYITVVLPLRLSGGGWSESAALFFVNRFFLILPVCMLFDYRDKTEDRKSGIKNIVAYINDRQLEALYVVMLILFFTASLRLYFLRLNIIELFILILPQLILSLIFAKSKIYKLDYWFYILLDGTMAFSGVLCLINRYIHHFLLK